MSSFEDGVRQWVKYDDELKRAQDVTRELREKRGSVALSLHEYISTHPQLKTATINISDGRLRFIETQTTQSLTFKFLEESLSEIITNKETVDKIMHHIKNKRTSKTTSDIKRYYADN